MTVNWVWQRYFGRGIVETENDFGTLDLSPSYPELWDWLASEFVGRGLSLKKTCCLLVNFATSRQSSQDRFDTAINDPRNRLMARQAGLRVESEIAGDSNRTSCSAISPRELPLVAHYVTAIDPRRASGLTVEPRRRGQAYTRPRRLPN